METIKHFFAMGGYGYYVWSAYGCVFLYLSMQWLLPWRKWLKFHRLYRQHGLTQAKFKTQHE